MTSVDFGRHSDDYATYRPGFPRSFYERIESLAPLNRSRAIDLATGPGTIALELAARGADVIGIDIAPELITAAERAASRIGLGERTTFRIGRAEETELEPDAFDMVTAGQCWHWFDDDRAFAEARRVLRPGGLLAIAFYSYLAPHSPLARETEALILSFNPTWTMAGSTGVKPALIDDVIRAGFEFVEAFCYDRNESFMHEAWRGRMRTCNGVGSGGLSPGDVERFDRALSGLLSEGYPEPVEVPHRVWCVVARKPLK